MQLGFLDLEVRDVPAWEAFFTGVLGLGDGGAGRFRMDGHAWRFQVREGASDDLATVGWELGAEELDQVVARARAAGVPVSEADPAARGVARRFALVDPGGLPVELVCGPALAEVPFASPLVRSGFVADELGLGHLVVHAPDREASRRFYVDILGFRLSDRIVTRTHGHDVDLSFFHANARHHSVAFGGPQRKRLHHFMVEARSMDDVGLCYDRCLRAGVRIAQTLGRHPNDRMFSFYAHTPSRFQFEFGWGGREVDDATWEPTVHDRISEWGHHPPQLAYRSYVQPPEGGSR